MQMFYKRLPLKNTFNTRDLGGIPLKEGITKWNKILRSDDLSYLDQQDTEVLYQYGVRTIIDLRSKEERESLVYPVVAPMDYISIPLVQRLVSNVSEMDKQTGVARSFELKDFYTECIDSCQIEIREVMEIIADMEGGVLFHCTAGKDRTGIISALVLGLVGARRSDITADYQTTHTFIKHNPRMLAERKPELARLLQSTPEWMEHTLDHIQQSYHSIEEYLLGIELPYEQIQKIRDKFVEGGILAPLSEM